MHGSRQADHVSCLAFLRTGIDKNGFPAEEAFSVFTIFLIGLGATLLARLFDFLSVYCKYSDWKQDPECIKKVMETHKDIIRIIFFYIYRLLMIAGAIALLTASCKGWFLLADTLV